MTEKDHTAPTGESDAQFVERQVLALYKPTGTGAEGTVREAVRLTLSVIARHATAQPAPSTEPTFDLAELMRRVKAVPRNLEAVKCDDGMWMICTSGDTFCFGDPNHQEPDDEKPFRNLVALLNSLPAIVAAFAAKDARIAELESGEDFKRWQAVCDACKERDEALDQLATLRTEAEASKRAARNEAFERAAQLVEIRVPQHWINTELGRMIAADIAKTIRALIDKPAPEAAATKENGNG